MKEIEQLKERIEVNVAYSKTNAFSTKDNVFLNTSNLIMQALIKLLEEKETNERLFTEEEMIQCVEFCQTEMQSHGYIGANKYTEFINSLKSKV